MDRSRYDAFTRNVTGRLAADGRVLAVIGLGSLADPTIRDRYSDHDFWIVVTPGDESSFSRDLSWLPDPELHLAVARFGSRGASVLYRNQHLVEVAVFSETTLAGQPTDRYVVLLDRIGIAPRLETLVRDAHDRRAERDSWPDAIANLALVVWTGVQRYRRGEYVAAHKSLRFQAVDALLAAAQGAGLLAGDRVNFLDPWRRLEVVHPALAAAIARALAVDPPAAATALLAIAVEYLQTLLPQQSWDAVVTVQGWIEGAEWPNERSP